MCFPVGLYGGSWVVVWGSNTFLRLLTKLWNGERCVQIKTQCTIYAVFVDVFNTWKNFEDTFRWREDANETMAMAMLDQVLYPIPKPLKSFVAQVFVSIVDWDSKFHDYFYLDSIGRVLTVGRLQSYTTAVSVYTLTR